MADKKISQLSSATTPVAGTEELPIVQSGSTVKVSIDNLTAGKTVKGATFDTDIAAAKVTLSGITLAAGGTDTNIDINITPKGTGEVNLPKVDIDAGAIDGTAIGSSSTSTGAFTTLTGTNIFTYRASDAVAVNDVWYVLGAVSSNQIWRLMITDSNTMATWHRADDLYIDKSSVATFKNIYDVNPGYATREWRVNAGNLEWRVTGAGGNTGNTVTAMRVA